MMKMFIEGGTRHLQRLPSQLYFREIKRNLNSYLGLYYKILSLAYYLSSTARKSDRS